MPLSKDQIVRFSDLTFIFGAATTLESTLIEKLKDFITRAIRVSNFSEDLTNLDINAAFNKDNTTPHQITVEFVPSQIDTLSFGNKIGVVDDEAGNTWHMFGGKWAYDVEITVRSMNRAAVARLADIILLGLQYPIRIELLKIGFELPIINMTLERLQYDNVPGFEHLYKTVLRIPRILVDWKQVYTESGRLIQEVDADINIEI